MSHVRMWSVAFNEMLHSNELKCWWIMSCRWWNLACLFDVRVQQICLPSDYYFPAWHFRYSTFVVLLTFRQLILTKSPCRWRTSINTQQEFGDCSNPHDLLLTQACLCQHQIMRIPQPCACVTLAMGPVIRCHLSISGPLEESWANLLLPLDSCRQFALFLLIRFFSFCYFWSLSDWIQRLGGYSFETERD